MLSPVWVMLSVTMKSIPNILPLVAGSVSLFALLISAERQAVVQSAGALDACEKPEIKGASLTFSAVVSPVNTTRLMVFGERRSKQRTHSMYRFKSPNPMEGSSRNTSCSKGVTRSLAASIIANEAGEVVFIADCRYYAKADFFVKC